MKRNGRDILRTERVQHKPKYRKGKQKGLSIPGLAANCGYGLHSRCYKMTCTCECHVIVNDKAA